MMEYSLVRRHKLEDDLEIECDIVFESCPSLVCQNNSW